MRLDSLHRTFARLALLCVIFVLPFAAAEAQEKQQHVKKVDFALYAADATIRSLDLVSTHALLSSPCKCFYEADPLAPGSREMVPQMAFHYGMSAAVILGHRELVRHHHPRLARLLIVADIASETYAVQSNFRQHETPRQSVTGMVPAGLGSRAGAF